MVRGDYEHNHGTSQIHRQKCTCWFPETNCIAAPTELAAQYQCQVDTLVATQIISDKAGVSLDESLQVHF